MAHSTADFTRFATSTDFHRWLQKNHAIKAELVVGFYKKDSGRGGLTYAEALDEALCFGWIDGVRRSLGADSYTIRFTPRKNGSIWSQVNIRHVERLTKQGRMKPTGVTAFAARTANRTGLYSFENRPQAFPPELEQRFQANRKAWTFFSQQPPGYQRTSIWWIISAKQEPTRDRRLARLMSESAASRRIDLGSPFGTAKS